MPDDDDIAEPSLLLAKHSLAHREHAHIHHHNLHAHYKRQAVVTEVVATVSVENQVDVGVDSNGNTLMIATVPTTVVTPDSSGSNALTNVLTEPSSSPTATIPPASPEGTTNPAPAALPSSVGSVPVDSASSQSLPSSQVETSPSTSIPSISSSLPSLFVSSNSTLISSSYSRFLNSTASSSTSSFTYLTSTSSSETSAPSTSSIYSPNISLLPATPTAAETLVPVGNPSTPGNAASSTAASGNGSSSSSAPPTPVVVGGVVGSLAGAAVIVFLLMFLIRWKRRQSMIALGNGDEGTGGTSRNVPPPQPSGGMIERRSLVLAVPATLAHLTGYKRSSQKTERTISSTAASERGFYRVSGRKLPSVLQSGGDGYGGGLAEGNTLSVSGSSFYRDSHGFFGPESPPLPPTGTSLQRDSGIPVLRPSPARTPVTEHGPFSSAPPPMSPPLPPDVLGRSHPSQDGSHASRFTEEV